MTEREPILVEIVRGDMVESYHRGEMVVMDARGSVIHSWGDPDKKVYARSTLKLLQALPLIETGAADALSISDGEITLACASHSSSPEHIESIQAWINRLGLSESDLECGACSPNVTNASKDPLSSRLLPSAFSHPCSGNHAGFLSTSLFMKEEYKGYIERTHPAQQRIEKTVTEMSEFDLASVPVGIDGCGIPVYGFPLKNLALAMAKFANPEGLPPKRIDAIKRMVSAIQKHPKLLAGENRFDTAVIEATNGEVIVKGGVEGMYIAIIPSLGYGAALKMNDGSTQASEIACCALLKRLGVLSENAQISLDKFLNPKIVNFVGKVVGERRPVIA